MKQVWKCDFCRETNDSFILTKDHENKCVFNPSNKKCATCKYTRIGYEFTTHCDHSEVSYFEHFDIEEDDLDWDKWEEKC